MAVTSAARRWLRAPADDWDPDPESDERSSLGDDGRAVMPNDAAIRAPATDCI